MKSFDGEGMGKLRKKKLSEKIQVWYYNMQQKSDNYEVEGNDIGPSSGYNNIDHQLQSQGK